MLGNGCPRIGEPGASLATPQEDASVLPIRYDEKAASGVTRAGETSQTLPNAALGPCKDGGVLLSGRNPRYRWASRTTLGDAAARRDPGRPNEDFVWARAGAFVMCDGMGGPGGGAIASRVAACRFGSLAARSPDLVRLAALVNRDVLAAASAPGGVAGMGTTLCAVVDRGWRPLRVEVVNVGDSRVWLVRNGAVSQLTTDHTYVQSLIDSGVVDAEDAYGHPRGHLVTRALGMAELAPADVVSLTLASGDRLVLTTDGVHDHVPPDVVCELLGAVSVSPAATAAAVVDAVLSYRGRDNATVTVVDVLDASSGSTAVQSSVVA